MKRQSKNGAFLETILLLVFSFAGFNLSLGAQQVPSTRPEVAEGYKLSSPPRVYVEVKDLASDIISPSALQSEMPFVQLATSLEEAQVHVLIRAEQKKGFIAYTLLLRGLKELAGEQDELRTELPPSASSQEVRQELLSLLKPGIMRFVGKSAISRRVQVNFLEKVKPTAVADPWNFWVFSLGVGSFANGEKSYNYENHYGSFSASRVTPEWKIRMSVNGSWSRNKYRYGDLELESKYESQNFRGLVVRSLSEHWSVGAYLNLTSSTYSNIKLSVAPAPAIEYNVFPYSESTRRQLRLLYRLSFTSVGYREETIYLKTRENLWRQSLTATLELKRRWGTISTSLEGSHYLHDLSKNRIELSTEVSLRLFKGLSFNINGDYSRIHDQLFLPRRGASFEEVILRRRQLETSYNYYFSVSLSYTFGSILSKVVNPRFGDGGGVSVMISM